MDASLFTFQQCLCLFGVAITNTLTKITGDRRRLNDLLRRPKEDWSPKIDEAKWEIIARQLSHYLSSEELLPSEELSDGGLLSSEEVREHVQIMMTDIRSISTQPQTPQAGPKRSKAIMAWMNSWILAYSLAVDHDMATIVKESDFTDLAETLQQCSLFKTMSVSDLNHKIGVAAPLLVLILDPRGELDDRDEWIDDSYETECDSESDESGG
jgi:hypothetical protein